ncbi:MAG TPA: sugar phosphate nucleotidyltransferase [Thermoplasmata archaeon]|nr:sugar phosphate nucleotidyltransferase [Thermoplasmata archaeon]
MRGVLTLAGEGTRMLPWSRGLRKEFLPLYDRGENGRPVLKPVAHLALETLSDAGADDVTLVVGAHQLDFVRTYFTVDAAFLRRHAHHADRLVETRQFYDRVSRLRLEFAVQPKPAGFGDAVARAEPTVGRHPFLLHAADAVLLEPSRGVLPGRMARLRNREDLDAVLLVRRVHDPRRYGVVETSPASPIEGSRRFVVRRMVEKPARPRSHWAATAVYALGPKVFDALRSVRRSKKPRELELTDAIQSIIAGGGRVEALALSKADGEWRSVGSPEGYDLALRRTRRWATAR